MAKAKIKKFEVVFNETEQEKIRGEISTLFKADKLVINDNENYEMTAEVLKLAKGKAKEIGAFYEEPKNFAHKIHKEICDMEKVDLEVLNKFEGVAKTAMSTYLLSLEEETKVEVVDGQEYSVPVARGVAPSVKGVSVSDKYDIEIEDVNLIPREYMIANEKMIKDMVKATNGTVVIPGVKVIKDKTISVRAD